MSRVKVLARKGLKVRYVNDADTLAILRGFFPESPLTARKALAILRYAPDDALTPRQLLTIIEEQDRARAELNA